ncbi:Oidioi.mRNA.OKI2018_I69.chr2.g5237.t1.cds [Oikopleura dioica]|uniref:Oidioi.mRNA.OKI2018_I69.chr2.g5237.t1.cds n=1 Tax=Oikopleura dioica TaxID=34765 RepID=A0ABN7T6E4_OIKDI|nr:Oidioi.mRNA.OKI2018_I69.chr2.g5237.t1.cds [Oikopleura dioica]
MRAMRERETVCVTELQSQWRYGGEQIHTIRRYCAEESALGKPYCLENNGGEESVKDCFSTCSNDVVKGGSIACNNNNDEVYALFKPQTHDPIVTSCKSCFYSEIPNGDPGLFRCRNNPGGQDNINCLPFQQAGCYASKSRIRTGLRLYKEVFRGCSAFPENLVEEGCYQSRGSSGVIRVCKSWCGENKCNGDGDDHILSTLPVPTTIAASATTTSTKGTTTTATLSTTSASFVEYIVDDQITLLNIAWDAIYEDMGASLSLKLTKNVAKDVEIILKYDGRLKNIFITVQSLESPQNRADGTTAKFQVIAKVSLLTDDFIDAYNNNFGSFSDYNSLQVITQADLLKKEPISSTNLGNDDNSFLIVIVSVCCVLIVVIMLIGCILLKQKRKKNDLKNNQVSKIDQTPVADGFFYRIVNGIRVSIPAERLI